MTIAAPSATRGATLWSSGFIDAIGRDQRTPKWELRAERSPVGGTGYAYSSHGGMNGPALIVRPPLVSPNRIQPVSWTPTGGAWSVEIGWPDAHKALSVCPRGTVVGLYLTLEGLTERVALGVVRNISGTAQAFRVECQGLTSALTGRLTDDPDEIALFHELSDGDTTVGSNYTAGDATIVLTSGANLRRDTDSGLWCVLVTPNTGDDFFITGTLAGNTITITTAGAFDTVDADADAGNAVTACAYINGHPFDIARKLLISGSSSSATWDTLPDDWGFALDGGWFAHGDINDYRDLVVKPSSGSYVWDLVVTGEIENGYAWLSGLLSLLGAWVTTKQGYLTFRACQNPNARTIGPVALITERALLGGPGSSWQWQQVAQEWSVEYGRVRVRSNATDWTNDSLARSLGTYPAQAMYEYDSTGLQFANETAMRAGDIDRLGPWKNPPEAFTLQTRGWKPGILCEGDFATLDLPCLRGLRTAAGDDYTAADVLVLEVSTNFAGDDTRLRVIPCTSGE